MQSWEPVCGEVAYRTQSILGSLSIGGFGETNKENFPQEESRAQEEQTSLLWPFFILHMGGWLCILPTEYLANKSSQANREISTQQEHISNQKPPYKELYLLMRWIFLESKHTMCLIPVCQC